MNDRALLTDSQIAYLVHQHPDLPSDYLEYLRTEGWGKAVNGHMIYEGPIPPEDIYGDSYQGPKVVLLGDDYQGYCFGYDFNAKCYGDVSDFGEWEPWPTHEGLIDYVSY
jgi:hypothetical protein